jgi:hypothetical protein
LEPFFKAAVNHQVLDRGVILGKRGGRHIEQTNNQEQAKDDSKGYTIDLEHGGTPLLKITGTGYVSNRHDFTAAISESPRNLTYSILLYFP